MAVPMMPESRARLVAMAPALFSGEAGAAAMDAAEAIVHTAAGLMADPSLEHAMDWFHDRLLPGFDNQTALDLVRAGRAPAVMAYLENLAQGGYA